MNITLLTVGHSPRDDLSPDMLALLGDGYAITQRGGLDAFSVEEVKARFAPKQGEDTLVSRLRGGEMYEMCRETVLPFVQQAILDAGNEGADAIILLCTGRFPAFKSAVPLLKPFDLLHSLVPTLAGSIKVGALFPFEAYAEGMAEDWRESGLDVAYACVRPPGDEAALKAAIAPLVAQGIGLLVLDCIGYTAQTKKLARAIAGVPVIHPKSLLASAVHNLT